MLDVFARADDGPEIVPAKKLLGEVAGVYNAPFGHFQTREADEIALTFEGVEGDFHAGYTRRSGGREPWYPRGTEIRNERQLSIVSPVELAEIAKRMEIREVKAEWVGANLSISGVPQLSMLPAGTLLFFQSGVTLKVDAQNGPCRVAGRAVAENARMPDHEAGSLLFPKAAKRLRGLVAWVEKPGTIKRGEQVSVRIPEQWIYR
ncbi:MAG: MOSC domain-containing protein [Rhizobiaceae bacterium]|nr:MOSC domain-containing protein [Rhizobiaceae bacterium]